MEHHTVYIFNKMSNKTSLNNSPAEFSSLNESIDSFSVSAALTVVLALIKVTGLF